MDFRFTEDEQEIIGQAAKSLRKHLPVSRLTESEATDTAWRAFGAEGWTHAGLPEAVGGGDLPLVLVAAIGREAGGVLAGDAYVDNAVLLPRLLASRADASSSGLDELLGSPGFTARDSRCGDGLTAHGVEPGLSAYRVTGDCIERFAPESWSFTPSGGLGVTTGMVRIESGPVSAFSIAQAPGDVLRDAAIVHAATLIGAGQAAVSETLEYVNTRHQFGCPIGRFQAVKHLLADVHVGLEVAWNAVLYAALRPCPEAVAIAQLQASRASDEASRAMIQLFGGIAMTWEHSAHWYVKVIAGSRERFGSVTDHALDLAGLMRTGEAA